MRVCAETETGGQWKGVVVSVSQITTQRVSSFKLEGGSLLVQSYYCKDRKMLPFGQLKVTTWETDLTFSSQEDQDGHYQHHHEMVITMVTNNNM